MIRRPDPELLRWVARFPLREVVLCWEEWHANHWGGLTYAGSFVELECGHIEKARGRKNHRCRRCKPNEGK